MVAGVWIAVGHIVTAAAQAVTIIGIPLAIANVKMIPVSLMPLGKQIVPTSRRLDTVGGAPTVGAFGYDPAR